MIRYRFLFPSLPDRRAFSRQMDDVFQSGWLSNRATKVRALENALSEQLEIEHVICVSSASLGLLVLIRALELPEGSRVLMPAFNFPASAEAVMWNRCTPAYAEIETDWLTLDSADAERCCGSGARAIMPVHSLGNLADVGAITSLAEQKNLLVVYDGASALGSLLIQKDAARAGLATVISLHATKIVPAAEGGAILTRDDRIAEACCTLINFGMDARHSVSHYGINAKMSELHAAFALAGLAQIDANLARRQELAQAYEELLLQVPWLRPHSARRAVMQLYPVTISSQYAPSTRSKLCQRWLEFGIETRSYYDPPLHAMPAFMPDEPLRLPVTEDVCARVICLPFHTRLTGHDVAEIVKRIQEAGAPIDG